MADNGNDSLLHFVCVCSVIFGTLIQNLHTIQSGFSDDETEDKQGVTDTDSDYDLDFDSYHPIRTTETPPVMLLSPKLSKVHLNDLQVRFSVHLSEFF